MSPEERKSLAESLRAFADKIEAHTDVSGDFQRTAHYANHSHFSWEPHPIPRWRTHETFRMDVTLHYREPRRAVPGTSTEEP